MMIPGVVAYHLYGPELQSIDLAYPQLVRDVLPVYATGFFLAVLLGAVLSSFNSLINSASTLFCIDVYQPLVGRAVSDTEMVRVAKRVGLVMTGFSLLVAPLLQFPAEGLWQVIRIFTGFYNIPYRCLWRFPVCAQGPATRALFASLRDPVCGGGGDDARDRCVAPAKRGDGHKTDCRSGPDPLGLCATLRGDVAVLRGGALCGVLAHRSGG